MRTQEAIVKYLKNFSGSMLAMVLQFCAFAGFLSGIVELDLNFVLAQVFLKGVSVLGVCCFFGALLCIRKKKTLLAGVVGAVAGAIAGAVVWAMNLTVFAANYALFEALRIDWEWNIGLLIFFVVWAGELVLAWRMKWIPGLVISCTVAFSVGFFVPLGANTETFASETVVSTVVRTAISTMFGICFLFMFIAEKLALSSKNRFYSMLIALVTPIVGFGLGWLVALPF